MSVLDRYGTIKMAMPLMAFNSSSSSAIASTWGFDILLEKQIDCMNENRLYGVKAQAKYDASRVFE
jgi:hypothetical protein